MNTATKTAVRARLNEAGRLLAECEQSFPLRRNERDAVNEAIGGISEAIAKLDALSIAEDDKQNP